MCTTTDLSKFGYRELDMVADLLKAYANARWDGENLLGDGVVPMMNQNSGNVFLIDEDYNVAMLTDDNKLTMFYSCPICGMEGFLGEYKDQRNHTDPECESYIEENLAE